MMPFVKNLYIGWTRLSPVKFVMVTGLVFLFLQMVISSIFDMFSITDEQIGSTISPNVPFWFNAVDAVIIAPIIETFIFQHLIIKIIQRFTKKKSRGICILISSLLFCLGHLSYSIWYSILVIPGGILLAETYLIFQERKESNFWMTTAVHALRNFVALIAILIESL